MPYAEVAVNATKQPGRTFSYSVPNGLQVRIGDSVRVPFGPREVPGFVFETPDIPAYSQTRQISQVVGSDPLLSVQQIKLAHWISLTYRCSLFVAASLMVPPGFRESVTATYALLNEPAQTTSNDLDRNQHSLIRLLRGRDPVPIAEIEKHLGKRTSASALKKLVRKGILGKSWAWRKRRVGPKLARRARVQHPVAEALARALELQQRAPKQSKLLEAVAAAGDDGVAVADLNREFGPSATPLASLEKQGLIALSKVRVTRDPLAGRVVRETEPLELTRDQREVWDTVSRGLSEGPVPGEPNIWLLFGVTGSGKTEIYLRALDRVVEQGRKGIVLVPEISLTPQTIDRFAGRFPGRVAVLHSHLSPGVQFDEWWRIHQGEFDVVIGARGAIFSPQPNVGLIVLDEEHEWTYKQHEQQPFYHSRDVAVKLADILGASVILGSATPSVESFYRARSGEYDLLELPNRIISMADGVTKTAPLPHVQVVDLRDELKSGNRSVFSRSLTSAISNVLERGEQAILFLNRRGSSTFVQCRDCGYVARCRKCDASLTHHHERDYLQCHQCNTRSRPLSDCPDCGGNRIRFMGLGTERLEAEVHQRFPGARTMRWDRDVARNAAAHEEIVDTFRSGSADILIGTQMLAKGLHFPTVTLVGVVNADIGLYLPDFRAPERVFQIVGQVSGRAGRGPAGGRVIVQTYSPENYAIAAAALQDYQSFYDDEVARRQELLLPPFVRLTRLIFQHTNEEFAIREAERVGQTLQRRINELGYPGARLIGPAPAPFERARGRWRWHLILRMNEPGLLLDDLPLPQGWQTDVDPISLL